MDNQTQPQDVTPPGPRPPTTSKPSSKKWKKVIFFSFLAIVLAYVIFAFFGPSRGTSLTLPKIPPTSVTPTPQWQTYTNAKYGYSIQYPSEEFINCDEAGDEFFLFDGNDCTPLGERPTEIYIIPKTAYYKPVKDSTCVKNTVENVTIGGIAATKYSREVSNDTNQFSNFDTMTCNPLNGYKQDSQVFYNVEHNGQIFEILTALYNKQEIKNQILSTFKFAGQEQATVNWQQYTDKKSGFTFKYPPHYELSKQIADSVFFGEKVTNGHITYLTITTNPKPYSAYKECVYAANATYESFGKQTPCITNNGKNTAIIDTTLGGRKAKSFYVAESAGDSLYHLVQTVDAPVIEARMFVAEGGLNKTFTEILSTFTFTN